MGGLDFTYGNARLRARRGELLGRSRLAELAEQNVDGLLADLAGTAYQPEVDAALTRLTGLSALHEAIRRHLARSLEEMRSFYLEGARALVDLLLSRWNLANLLTLVRGRVRGLESDEIVASIVPLGEIDEDSAREVASQSDAGRAVDLLVAWRLPDGGMARALASAWRSYLRTEDLTALEAELAGRHARRLHDALGAFGSEADPVRVELAERVDARNLVTALRLRRAIAREELEEPASAGADGPFLTGGSIPIARLEEAAAHEDDGEALALLSRSARGGATRRAIARLGEGRDLVLLEWLLEEERTRAATELFVRGDPLGIEIPIAFTAAKESEARDLRVLAEGAARRLPSGAMREEAAPA